MNVNSRIRAIDQDPQLWAAYMAIDHPEHHDCDYFYTVNANAPKVKLSARFVISQWHEETNGGTSPRWNGDYNPAGISIVADSTKQPFTIANGTEAALLHLSCLNRLVADPQPEPWKLTAEQEHWVKTVWEPHVKAGPVVRTIADLSIHFPCGKGDQCATWAWDTKYGENIVGRYNLLFPDDPDLKITQLIVEPNGANVPGWTLSPGPVGVTVHENDNTSATARSENNWVRQGGGGGSTHGSVDHREGIQTIRLDQVGFHAADGCDNREQDFGCFDTVAFEIVDVPAGDIPTWERTLRNAVQFAGKIKLGDHALDYGTRAISDFANLTLYRHYDVNAQDTSANRHVCPHRIIVEDRWEQFKWAVYLYIQEHTMTFTTAEKPPAKPAPVRPGGIPEYDGTDKLDSQGTRFVALSRKVTAGKIGAHGHKYASASSPVGKTWVPGALIDVLFTVDNGHIWYITKEGWRVPSVDIVEQFTYTRSK